MIRKTDIYKVLSILVIVFLQKSNLLIPGVYMEIPVAELFLQNIFAGNPSRENTDVVIAMFGLLEIIIFNLLFGTYIYRDLYENTAYIFVRVKSRSRWFFKKAKALFVYSGIYNALFLGSTFLLCVGYSQSAIDKVAVRLLIITFILIQLFVFWSTLLINLLAIGVGATKAFLINYIMLALMSAGAVNFEKIPLLNQFPILLKLNPVANVVINWNDGMGKGLIPAIYFVVIIIITYEMGRRMILGMDIGINNKEYE